MSKKSRVSKRRIERRLSDVAAGFRLIAGLEAIGMSKADLARTLGVGQQNVSNWTLGKNAIQGEFIIRIYRITGLDANYLICGLGHSLPAAIRAKLPSYALNDGELEAKIKEFLAAPPKPRRKTANRSSPALSAPDKSRRPGRSKSPSRAGKKRGDGAGPL